MTWSEFQQVYKGNIQWTVKTAESEHRENMVSQLNWQNNTWKNEQWAMQTGSMGNAHCNKGTCLLHSPPWILAGSNSKQVINHEKLKQNYNNRNETCTNKIWLILTFQKHYFGYWSDKRSNLCFDPEWSNEAIRTLVNIRH